MSETTAASYWSDERAAKWLAGVARMEAGLAPVDGPLIDALALDRAYRIVDVGCGGGGTTLEVARRAPGGSVVHGYDLSRALVDWANGREQARERGVRFRVADMQREAPPEALYDRMVSRFGVMFFPDPPAAFANLCRWVAPGGRFAFAVWGPLEENVWMTSVRDAVGGLVEAPRLDSEGPGAFRYAETDRFRGLLETAGWSEVAVREWRGDLAIGGGLRARPAAEFALGSFSSFSELLGGPESDLFQRACESLTARFVESERDGAVTLQAHVRIVTGVRRA
ncbi:MAG: class I SAM-dependent methyltransferase [Bryobacteraceae bacterium]|nr:class I SAM-dependent methyltransferase [Bryobacteraceae bacterium]